MKQAVHIFLKDIRHFFKEIALSWCLLALFTWHSVDRQSGFTSGYMAAAALWRVGSQFIGFLLVMSWWMLIIRAVQDESLAGDRQFWVTRPYRWPQLLTEKILFILLFINLPLLIAQLVILKINGFPSFIYVGGLLAMQVSLAMMFLLPVFLLAAVTARFVHVVFAALAVVLYLSFHSAVIAAIPNSSMPHAMSFLDVLFTIVAILAVLTVVLLQYARRQTVISRTVIATTAMLMTILAAITPYESLIAKEFPRTGAAQQNPLSIALDTRKPEKPAIPTRPPRQPKPAKKITVTIPLLASTNVGIDIVSISGTRFSFDLPKGGHWQSQWQRQYSIVLLPDSPQYLAFEVPKEIFDSIDADPISVNLEMALAVYRRSRNQWQVIADEEDFAAPQLGICRGIQYPTQGIECRAPLHGPHLILATVNSSQSTCPALSSQKSSEPIPNTTGYFWSLPFTSGYGGILDPIVDERVYFNQMNLKRMEDMSKLTPRICPGTPMDFTLLEFVRNASMMIALNGIRLRDYRAAAVGSAVLVAR
ncbi:MAG TPA: hypothetical protein VG498_13380 [Terriglobales bacterium]|nr:hypothetical protein [Terriglobales bacterium]